MLLDIDIIFSLHAALEEEKTNEPGKGLSQVKKARSGQTHPLSIIHLCLQLHFKQKLPQEKLEESVDTFSICTSSSTSVLDTSADTSFDKEQRKISAHATLQVDDIASFVYVVDT